MYFLESYAMQAMQFRHGNSYTEQDSITFTNYIYTLGKIYLDCGLTDHFENLRKMVYCQNSHLKDIQMELT